MAGSRIERFGSIYSRVKGLLSSGALKDADKPLWLSIYEQYPPKEEPVYDRPIPEKSVPNILYKEDLVRAKFHQQFGNVGITDMTNFDTQKKNISEKFIDRYKELEKRGDVEENLFYLTARSLRGEGYYLKTLEEMEKERKEKREARRQEEQKETKVIETSERNPITASELFGKRVVEDDEDY